MMLENPAIIWLILVILLLVIEIATMGLTTIWFAGGAVAAFISTFYGASPTAQRTILIITRPIAVKYMKKGQPKTNVDSMVGRIAVVTSRIDNLAQSGEVVISDISWTARSKEASCIIPAGSKVRICAIEGVKLIVEELKEDR